MLLTILQTIWLFLPSGFANMAPTFFLKSKFLDYPINKKIFGKNKTYKGFFVGIITAILIVYLQKLISPFTSMISLIDYFNINTILLGFLLGFIIYIS